MLGQPPAGAYYQDGKLLLQYGSGKDAAFLGAAWPGAGQAADQYAYHTSVIDRRKAWIDG
jgi:hypothetical protein